MSHAEPSQRAKFAAAIKHQQKFATEHPEIFQKAREIMQRVTDGDILFMAGLMEALQEGRKLAQDDSPALPSQAPAVLRQRRSRS